MVNMTDLSLPLTKLMLQWERQNLNKQEKPLLNRPVHKL
jgi:hypothetical protein